MFDDFENEMSEFDLWRLCDQLSIIQAALLVAGHDPSALQNHVEAQAPKDRPPGYEAAKAAISRGLISGSLDGIYVRQIEHDINGNFNGYIDDTIDLENSMVEVPALVVWLSTRGVNSGFFFPKKEDGAEFLDPDHDRYSQKLAATILAW